MEDIRVSFQDFRFYLIIANVLLGVLFGSLPLIVGQMIDNRKYALRGFIACVVGGAVLGVFLAYPLCVLFMWLLLKPGGHAKPVEAPAADHG